MEQARNILIIDDEPNFRSLFRRQLKEEGFRALEAEDGEKALELIKANKDIGLVILDILLPTSSGLEIYDEIRKQFPEKKIIVSSVHPADEQTFLISDADDYYYKSESISLLVEKIRAILGRG